MKHTISVLMENEFGVLSRISGLFSGRGFNIQSLSVAPTLDPSISRMTIVTSGDEQILEQINKQLNKLIDTVNAEDNTRAQLMRIVDIFRGKVIDVTPKSYTLEMMGTPEKVNAIVEILRPIGIKELVRTGPVVLGRGAKGWKSA